MVTTLLVLFTLFALAFGNQHLVCKTIDDVFSSDAESRGIETSRRLQGPPGKKGIPGPRGRNGLPGPPGPQSVVNYHKTEKVINETIQRELVEVNENFNRLLSNQTEEMDEKLTGVQRGIEKLEKKFQELLENHTKEFYRSAASSMVKLEAKFQELLENNTNEWHHQEKLCRDQDGLFYNGVCYIVILEGSNKVGATEKCRRIGGLLAEIHTREQETALIEYVRPKLSSSYKHFWIGMEYHHPNVRYRSGKEIGNEQFQWYSRSSNVRYTNMYLLVYSSKNSNDGLWNDNAAYDYFYTICEKSI